MPPECDGGTKGLRTKKHSPEEKTFRAVNDCGSLEFPGEI